MSVITQTQKFAALSANGNTATLTLVGQNTVSVYLDEGATWGGGTLKMQMSPDGGTTWLDVPSASWTSGDGKLADVTVLGKLIRFNLAGATGPSITVAVVVTQNSYREELLFNFTANGDSAVFTLPHEPSPFGIAAYGSFGGGTLKLRESPDAGVTWYDVTAGNTANGLTHVSNHIRNLFKFTLSGATTPNVNGKILQ